VRLVKEGGFTFRPPVEFSVDVQSAQVRVFDKKMTILISFVGSTSNPQNESPEEIADEFLNAVFKKANGEFQKVITSTVSIDGVEGLAYDITGTLFGRPTQGQAVIVMPGKNQYLFGLGMNNLGGDPEGWENEGRIVFNAMISSISFSTGVVSTGGCVISSDNTYGYSKENPIRVGGDDFGGPPREDAYMDNLLGPQGEKISYERTGSFDFGDTILDSYEVRGLKKVVTLYIDEYSYSEPLAPVGFTCGGAFTLAPP
jgi:hypothetical protein